MIAECLQITLGHCGLYEVLTIALCEHLISAIVIKFPIAP